MSSVIEGYLYDIFISYRQKDNKGDRWVSEFVEALKTELESTFKEEISVYFDINPRDGLLETHDVNASLKEKLKCLVFIPIISRTYCDPRSFAWEHEFKTFVDQASQDQFGLKIKLPNGNVASRVLPISIYDLDNTDIKLCESVLGGFLRGVEFIYKEPGVNRPLLPKDSEERNLNNSNYRNQINKVANVIKEVIAGLKPGSFDYPTERTEVMSTKDIRDIQEKSIAVLPFVDMSPEKDQDYFCDGMAEEIINTIAHNDNLKVIARTSAFAFKDKHEDVREIGKKLGVETLLAGSVRKAGNRIRITVQLIKVDDGSHIWSDHYDREIKDVFAIQDEISLAIMDNLKVKLLGEKKKMITKLHSENIEAYNLYLKGTYYWQMLTAEGYRKAAECFKQALQKDPNYALAYIGLSYVTGYSTAWGNLPPNEGFPKINEYMNKVLEMDKNLAEVYSGLGGLNVYFYRNWKEAERNYKHALQINPNAAQIHLDYSNFLTFTGRHEEAIFEAKRAQNLDPLSIYINTYTGFAFDYAGQYDKAIDEYRITLEINPNYFITHYHLGRAYFAKGMIKESIVEYEKAVDLSDGTPLPVAVLACSYYMIGKKDQGDRLFESLKKRSEIEYVPATTIFLIYKVRGEEEKALDWLRKACNDHDTLLPWFRAHPLLVPEGSSYMKLLKEAGLDY
jgi:TolB-like protein/tetratricopeptide (TPR) repeat protein